MVVPLPATAVVAVKNSVPSNRKKSAEWRKIGEWSGKPVEIALGVDSRSTSFDACAVVVQEGDEGPVRGAIAFGLRRAGGS